MNALQLLSRSEMKIIIGGIDECNETNCQICETGDDPCKEFDQSIPAPGCTWGHCGYCCDD